MQSPDQYWSILINIDQDFSLPKSHTLFQNNYYADSWSILINIDLYWAILIRINIDQNFFKTTIMPSPESQYWSLIRNFLYQSHTLFQSNLCRVLINNDQYWSILINIDQDFSLPKSQTLFQNNYYADPDQYWSILIYIDQYWSKLINIDLYWSILIYIDRLCFKTTIDQNQYWSILINIYQDFSLPKSLSVSKQLLCRVLINKYWSILIYIDQYWSGLFFTKVTDSVSK